MNFTSQKAKEVLKLNKREVTKRLQTAVRDTQGGKRTCWAPSERPSWWREKYEVTLPGGEVVESLPFVSQSKQYWAIESARVTLLLYEFQEHLDNAQNARESEAANAPIQILSPQPHSQPEVLEVTIPEPVEVVVHDSDHELDAPEQPSDVQTRVENDALESRDDRVREKRTRRKKTVRKANDTQISPGESDTTGFEPSSQETNNSHSDDPEESRQEDGDETKQDADDSTENASTEQLKKIRKEIEQLKTRTRKELAVWEESQAQRRKTLEQSVKHQIERLQAEFRVSKLRIPPNVISMSMKEYTQHYSAEALPFLNKEIEDAVEEMLSNPSLLAVDDNVENNEPQSYSEKRRNELTATARKTSRAVRRRQLEQATPSVRVTRSRTQRESAVKATDRNRQLFQGTATRNQKPISSSARPRKDPVDSDMATPAARLRTRHVDNPRLKQYMETARQQKGNKREFCHDQARKLRETAMKELDEAEQKRREAQEKLEKALDWDEAADNPGIEA